MERLRSIGGVALVAWCVGSVLAGCADRRAWTTADAWYQPADHQGHVDGETLRDVPWVEVRAEARAAAERRLERSAVVPLRPDEVAGYAAAPFDHPGSTAYLVRAVYLNRHGRFYVQSDGRDLFVGHGSLGRRPVPMKRQPLLVALPAEPRHVDVSCFMAQ